MSACFVVNPAAGRGRGARAWAQVAAGLAAGDWEVVHTRGPRHATELAHAAVARGHERVIAVGGDGTLSEVALGVAGSGAAVGVVPAGRGNDFAPQIGVPADPVAAARLALEGSPAVLDLGWIEAIGGERRVFVNVAGFGFDGEVLRSASRVPPRLGGLAYPLGVLVALGLSRPRLLDITLDGVPLPRQPILLGAVANGGVYGGGMRVAPAARLDDGQLDVCLAGALGRVAVLGLLPRIYRGTHLAHPRVSTHTAREVRLEGEPGVPVQADGDLVGETPARFWLEPGGMRCVTGRPFPRRDPR